MPTVRTTRPRKTWDGSTIKFLTQTELRSLLRVIKNKRDYAIFLLAYRHGLRVSEIGLLQVGDLDLSRFQIMIHRVKDSISGEHVMQPDEVKAVKACLRDRGYESPILFTSKRRNPISTRQLDNLMKDYGKLADIPKDKRHFHVLKHSITTHLLQGGARLHTVNAWVGHASIKNTMIYTHISNPERDEEVRRVMTTPSVV